MEKVTERQEVTCNGFPGIVYRVCVGQLRGMAEVTLSSGVVCVDISELKQPIYRNRAYKKRNYELTNIVACQPIDGGTAIIPPGYDHAPESTLSGLTPLWIEGGVRYWGYM